MIAPPAGGVTALIGVVIAHIRLGHAAGSFLASHYRNQIVVFWTMLICSMLALGAISMAAGISVFTLFWPFGWPWHAMMLGAGWLTLMALGGFLSLALVIWYYWRLIRGFMRALDDKPY